MVACISPTAAARACRRVGLVARKAAAAAPSWGAWASSMAAPVHLTLHARSPDETAELLTTLRQQSQEFPDNVHWAVPAESGVATEHEQPAFDGALYTAHLTASSSMGTPLLATPEIGSTQEFMRAHQSRLPLGTVLVADRQVAGKGRGGNQWTSPPGCLMFTASRRLTIPGAQAPFVNYVVCLAVLRGIEDAASVACPGVPPLGVRIKWPNDIYGTWAGPETPTPPQQPPVSTPAGMFIKIGGALMHTTWSSGGFNLLVGVGLNVSNRAPTTCLQALLEQALAVDDCPAPVIRPEVLLARIVSHLDACLQVFEQHGFAPLEADYLKAWLHSGQRVLFQGDAEQSVGGDADASGGLVAVRICGLTPSGFLLAEEEGTGRRFELTPDGNSLDMMAGLIRKKLT